MQYIHVAAKPPESGVDYNGVILHQVGLCLYSLIEGFRSQDFNTHTLNDVMNSIRKYTEKYVDPVGGILYADSGGYSIIVGQVHPVDIPRLNQCYDIYMEHEKDIYGRIFSLDIPWNKGFPSMNTKEKIAHFNRMALSSAKTILTNFPEIRDKYYFVWHFKMQAQYDIWKKIYEDLELNKIIKHRAIGGMVGLRGITHIKFSPFTAISFRCLLDYLDAGDFDNDFTLHYLGMYALQDRFHMVVLEKLFQKYLEGVASASITYDSINISHTARMNKYLKFYHWDGNNLTRFNNLIEAPTETIKAVYPTEALFEFVLSEIERRRGGERLVNVNTLGPLNIFSNRQLDLFFEWFVEAYGLVDLIYPETSLTRLNVRLGRVLDDLEKKYPVILPKTMRASIMENFKITFFFNRWFLDSRDRGQLDSLMTQFIAKIGFPGSLS